MKRAGGSAPTLRYRHMLFLSIISSCAASMRSSGRRRSNCRLSYADDPYNKTECTQNSACCPVNDGQLVGRSVDLDNPLNDRPDCKSSDTAVPQTKRRYIRNVFIPEYHNTVWQRAAEQRKNKGKKHEVGINSEAECFIDSCE